MNDTITIAIDAMGGDRAPGMVLKGAEIALQRHPGVRYLLFGAEAEIRPLIAKLPNLSEAYALPHDQTWRTMRSCRRRFAPTAVEHAARYRRCRRRSGDGVVSAGNTGALMAMAKGR